MFSSASRLVSPGKRSLEGWKSNEPKKQIFIDGNQAMEGGSEGRRGTDRIVGPTTDRTLHNRLCDA